jgi:hypothetical protein
MSKQKQERRKRRQKMINQSRLQSKQYQSLIWRLPIILLVAFSMYQPMKVQAQATWDTNGTDAYRQTGNIGIGTSNPQTKLSVNGDASGTALQLFTVGTAAGSPASIAIINAPGSSASTPFNVLQIQAKTNGSNSTGSYVAFNPINSNGTGWSTGLIVANGGNIGIGTTSPSYRLQIVGDNTASYPLIKLQNTQAGGHSWWLYSGALGQAGSFGIYDETAGLYRLFFDGSGNVGLGTTSPSAKLSFGTTSGVPLIYLFQDVATFRYGMGIQPGEMQFFVPDAGHISFNKGGDLQAGGTGELMRIAGNGNVGIGTTNPGRLFHIYKGSGTSSILIESGGGSSVLSIKPSANTQYSYIDLGDGSSFGWQLGKDATAGGMGGDNGFYIYEMTTGQQATRFAINKGGNVGIGTMNPGQKLDVVGQIRSSGGFCIGTDCKTSWADIGGSSQWSNGTGNIYYNTGNVGVGTQTPVQKLQVAGAVGATGGLAAGNSGNGAFLYDDGTKANLAAYTGTNARPLNISGQNIIFSTGTTYAEKMRIDGLGNVTVAGDITASGAINAKYQDVAEYVPSSQKLQAGTVVILDPERTNQVIASRESYDTRVAGVISDSPGLILGEGGEGKVKVATTGRVKVKVDATRGPIKIGDLLVTSDEEGVAMKSEPINFNGRLIHSPGTIIGKALEPLKSGKGEILVLLSLQ